MPGLMTLPSSYLRGAQQSYARSVERLASGLRINRAADDPAGLAVAENLDARARSLTVAQRNLADGHALMATLDATSGEVGNVVKRLRELAVQGASETLHDDERAYLEQERRQLTDEVDRMANTTELFGRSWLDGAAGAVDVQAGPGQGDTIELTAGDVRTGTLGIGGLDFTTAAGARAALPTLDAALSTVNGQRSQYGASMNRLASAMRLADEQARVHRAAAGRIMDADMAHEAAELARAQIRMQTSVMAMRQVHQLNRRMVEALLA